MMRDLARELCIEEVMSPPLACLAAFLVSSFLIGVGWAVLAPGVQRTRVVVFEFSRSARHLGVAERLAGVGLVLADRALLLNTIDAKGPTAAVRGFQLATMVALDSRAVVYHPWNQHRR